MLVLNKSSPQAALSNRCSVLRLVPEREKIIHDIYDVVTIEQTIKNESGCVGLPGEHSARKEWNQGKGDYCSLEARHSQLRVGRQELAQASQQFAPGSCGFSNLHQVCENANIIIVNSW